MNQYLIRMTENEQHKAYVYLHRNSKTKVVFYVGISKDNNNGRYYRANRKYNRSVYWNNYTKKHKYFVEIYKDNISWEEACDLEKQLIFEYGRKENKCGSLVNLTDGGEGCVCLSDETKLESSNRTKQMWMSGRLDKKLKPVFQYDDNGKLIGRFSSHTEAMNKTGVGRTMISACVRGCILRAGGYYWSNFDNLKSIPSTRRVGEAGSIAVVGYDIKTDSIYKFKSQIEAEEYFNISFLSTSISKCLKGELNMANDMLWYKEKHNKSLAIEKRNSIRQDRAVVKIDLNGNATIYESLQKASTENNIDTSGISACYRGKQLTAGGYRWEKLNKYNYGRTN